MSITQFAFMFPGQGSQSVGMLSDFSDNATVQSTFEEASSALGYDLWALVANGPAEDLNETHRTQPALLTASTALWRLWRESAPSPQFLAGHSLGEYSALVASNVLSLSDAVKLVESRGHYMQKAVPTGTGKMAAIIGLDDEKIIEACNKAEEGEVVSAVNFNSPGQVVIAGNANAVERAMELCKSAGAKRALPLPVSVPSHCALMESAAESLATDLEQLSFNQPEISIVNNVDVSIETDGEAIKKALIRQLYSPVRWTETIQKLKAQNVTHLFECGAGNVLSGLAKRIDRSLVSSQMANKNALNQSLEILS